jgi:hypothetical protein
MVDGSMSTAVAAEQPDKSALIFSVRGASYLIDSISTNERKEKNAAGIWP